MQTKKIDPKRSVPILLLNEERQNTREESEQPNYKKNITQLASPGVKFSVSVPEHSLCTYESYYTEETVPIPLLNEHGTKYYGST
jgi:hypothetical protein